MSRALRTSVRSDACGRRQVHRSCDQLHARTFARPQRARRQNPMRPELRLPMKRRTGSTVCVGRSGADQHTRTAQESSDHAGAAISAMIESASSRRPGARFTAGLAAAGGRTEQIDTALAQRRDIGLRRGVRPHLLVHRRRECQRRGAGKAMNVVSRSSAKPWARRAIRSALAGANRIRCAQRAVRCGPWPPRPPRPTQPAAHRLPGKRLKRERRDETVRHFP